MAAAGEEVDQVLALTGVHAGAVLDLCCGPERHAVEFARRGFAVASPFQPGSDHHLASGLEDTGGGAQTLGVKLPVAHASTIVEDVERAFGRLGEGSGMRSKSVDDGVQFAIIQFSAARRCPLFAFAGCAEDRLSGFV